MTVKRAAALFLFLMSIAPLHAEQFLMFAGTYTNKDGKSKGIYAYRFDSVTGKATALGLAAETLSPTWLALSHDRRFLYSVNEQGPGSISSFALEGDTGKLRFLNTVSSQGSSPCHIELDPTGKLLYGANYGGATIAAFPVKPEGALGQASPVIQLNGSSVNAERQKGPHPHSMNVMKDGTVLVPDLGQDKILIYKPGLVPAEPAFAKVKPGSGPRHLALHPKGNPLYVLTEMGSTVEVLSRDNFTELQTISTLPKDFSGKSTGAEIAVHPTGKFVYASNRGNDSIAVFSTDSHGLLKLVEIVPTQGKTPRGFVIDPTGHWLIAGNQDSGTMIVFRIGGNGKLTATGSPMEIGAPVAFQFVR